MYFNLATIIGLVLTLGGSGFAVQQHMADAPSAVSDTATRAGSPACNDGDGDGFGWPGDPSCPNGAEDDCDDGDPDVYPRAVETS